MGSVVTKVCKAMKDALYEVACWLLQIELEFPVVLRWEWGCRLVPWLNAMFMKEVVLSGMHASERFRGHFIDVDVSPEECMTDRCLEIPEFFTFWKQTLFRSCIPIKGMEAEKILTVACVSPKWTSALLLGDWRTGRRYYMTGLISLHCTWHIWSVTLLLE